MSKKKSTAAKPAKAASNAKDKIDLLEDEQFHASIRFDAISKICNDLIDSRVEPIHMIVAIQSLANEGLRITDGETRQAQA